jgi:hypothetical protein
MKIRSPGVITGTQDPQFDDESTEVQPDVRPLNIPEDP